MAVVTIIIMIFVDFVLCSLVSNINIRGNIFALSPIHRYSVVVYSILTCLPENERTEVDLSTIDCLKQMINF